MDETFDSETALQQHLSRMKRITDYPMLKCTCDQECHYQICPNSEGDAFSPQDMQEAILSYICSGVRSNSLEPLGYYIPYQALAVGSGQNQSVQRPRASGFSESEQVNENSQIGQSVELKKTLQTKFPKLQPEMKEEKKDKQLSQTKVSRTQTSIAHDRVTKFDRKPYASLQRANFGKMEIIKACLKQYEPVKKKGEEKTPLKFKKTIKRPSNIPRVSTKQQVDELPYPYNNKQVQ